MSRHRALLPMYESGYDLGKVAYLEYEMSHSLNLEIEC